jgi:outer membrane receptor for ferrienterochelin and colicin
VYRDINRASPNGDSAYFSSSINANTAKVYGLELSNKTSVTKWWDLNLSFNLFKSAIEATIPGQNVNNDLTSWFSKMNNTFKLSKTLSFQFSGQYQAKTILPPGGSQAEVVDLVDLVADLAALNQLLKVIISLYTILIWLLEKSGL